MEGYCDLHVSLLHIFKISRKMISVVIASVAFQSSESTVV